MKVKRTLQEIADFFGCYVVINNDYEGITLHLSEPYIGQTMTGGEYWVSNNVFCVACIDIDPCDYGDWKDSLTMPSDPPFEVGELVIHKEDRFVGSILRIEDDRLILDDGCGDFSEKYRRPTKEEAKKLMPYMFED